MGEARGETFDEQFYERFYGNPRTRVVSQKDIERLGGFVCAYLRHLDLPVRRVLDIGCGLGYWKNVIAHHLPKARYTGIEHSAYLCGKYGWQRGSVVDFRARRPSDLVICQGVLQYLGHRDAARAVENLTELCTGALYLEVLTTEDWEENVDRGRTDGQVHLRKAAWYRRRLANAFVNCGGGVFVRRDAEVAMFELEKAE